MSQKGSAVAGLSAIAFGVLTAFAMGFINAPGGNYDDPTVASYGESGHLPVVIISGYLAMLGVLGLIYLLAYLRKAVASGSEASLSAMVFWGSGLASAAALAVGWGMVTGVALAAVEGGTDAKISHATTYVLSDTSLNVIWGSAGVLLGFSLFTLVIASRGTLPNWLRWTTMVVAVMAVGAPAFFPSFAIPLWALVMGVRLLLVGRFPLASAAVRQAAAS
ncbi:MAG TPA: hypothetical protein VF160_08860 [Candidatus Dormibacteraeota bacterium]